MTPSNPTGNPSDPWSSGGLFRGGFRAQIGDRAADLSSGNTAVNQWKYPNMFHGAVPGSVGPEEGAVGASQAPYHISPESRAQLGMPPRTPDLYDFYGLQNPNQTIPKAQPTRPQTPQGPQPPRQPFSPARSGMFGSPRPGFNFGGGY